MAGDDWYYAQAGRQNGPVAEGVLREMIQAGQVAADDLLWRDGMPEWAPAHACPELGLDAYAAPASAAGATAAYPPHSYGAVQPLGYYAPAAGSVPYAGFWKRFAAYLIDAILMWLVGVVLTVPLVLLAGGELTDAVSGRTRAPGAIPYLRGAMSLLLNWLYFALLESSAHQATLGKMALGIVVTDLAGQRISFGRATARHFSKILSGLILLIGYIMAGFTERKQALHDMIASTLVVNRLSP